MAVPTRAEAEQLLASFHLPDGIVTHSRGVSRVAGEAARLLAAAGVAVDPQLVEVAALLHDVDKLETGADGRRHGLVGARWISERGHPELADAIASHPIACLLDSSRRPRGWASIAVAVADRHVAQDYRSIEERLDDLAQRYPAFADELVKLGAPAHAMEIELAGAAGLTPAELDARLRGAWEAADA